MKSKLFLQMLFSLLTPVIIGIVLLFFSAAILARHVLIDQVEYDLNAIATLQARELVSTSQFLTEVVANLSEVARVVTYLEAIKSNASESELKKLFPAMQTAVEEVKRNFSNITDVGILDTKGTVLAHTKEGFAGTSLADRVYFKEALSGKDSVATVKSKATGITSAMFASPIHFNNAIIGVAYLSFDMKKVKEQILSGLQLAGESIVMLYDENGILLVHPNETYIGDDDSQTQWLQTALKNKNGQVHYEWNGVEKIGFYQYVPLFRWTVIVALELDKAYKSVNSMQNTMLIISFGILFIMTLLIMFIARSISRPLGDITFFAKHISEGNFDIPKNLTDSLDITSKKSGEMGMLATAIRIMVNNLKAMISQSDAKTQEAERATIQANQATLEAEAARSKAEHAKKEGMLAAANQLDQIVNVVSSASTELSAQILHSERGANNQAQRITETATAMEEMNYTVLEVAKNAGVASEVSHTMHQKAVDGAAIVREALKSITDVQNDSIALKGDMHVLSEHAKAISQILNVISDIADQTNLLALNAAIEAARAGEAGRGFAVVADEVRILAEKTMASTNDVAKTIKLIQESASSSVRQVDVAVGNIEKATDLASRSGTALEELVLLVDNTADQVRIIAVASEEQSSTSEEINRAISEINLISTETAQAMKEANKAVSELTYQAQELTRLIDVMKHD